MLCALQSDFLIFIKTAIFCYARHLVIQIGKSYLKYNYVGNPAAGEVEQFHPMQYLIPGKTFFTLFIQLPKKNLYHFHEVIYLTYHLWCTQTHKMQICLSFVSMEKGKQPLLVAIWLIYGWGKRKHKKDRYEYFQCTYFQKRFIKLKKKIS